MPRWLRWLVCRLTRAPYDAGEAAYDRWWSWRKEAFSSAEEGGGSPASAAARLVRGVVVESTTPFATEGLFADISGITGLNLDGPDFRPGQPLPSLLLSKSLTRWWNPVLGEVPQPIREASAALVEAGEQSLRQLRQAYHRVNPDRPLPVPASGQYFFFLAATDGVWQAMASEEELRTGQHPLSCLHQQAMKSLAVLEADWPELLEQVGALQEHSQAGLLHNVLLESTPRPRAPSAVGRALGALGKPVYLTGMVIATPIHLAQVILGGPRQGSEYDDLAYQYHILCPVLGILVWTGVLLGILVLIGWLVLLR